uniref:Uncharacterized protein n=1 Tax=Hemiarma marina TaxID=1848298 RepID=A0A679ETK7_9CRYP
MFFLHEMSSKHVLLFVFGKQLNDQPFALLRYLMMPKPHPNHPKVFLLLEFHSNVPFFVAQTKENAKVHLILHPEMNHLEVGSREKLNPSIEKLDTKLFFDAIVLLPMEAQVHRLTFRDPHMHRLYHVHDPWFLFPSMFQFVPFQKQEKTRVQSRVSGVQIHELTTYFFLNHLAHGTRFDLHYIKFDLYSILAFLLVFPKNHPKKTNVILAFHLYDFGKSRNFLEFEENSNATLVEGTNFVLVVGIALFYSFLFVSSNASIAHRRVISVQTPKEHHNNIKLRLY